MNLRRLAIIWLALLLAAPPAVAQVPRRAGRDDLVPFGQQTHAFRALLNEELKKVGGNSIDDLSQLVNNPANTVLIILGETRGIDQQLLVGGKLWRFLNSGGAVLIATDRPTSPGLYSEIGVRVSGEIVQVPTGSDKAWRGMAECPFVQETRFLGGRRPALFEGLTEPTLVATNNPSCIGEWVLPAVVVANLPVGDQETIAGVIRRQVQKRFAATLEFSTNKGRLLVMADHSVFINDMMLQPDNHNIDFAGNVARWLIDGRRSEVLYIEDGNIRTDFEVSLEYPPPRLPPVEVLLPWLNQMLIGLERENAFNRMVLQAFGTTAAVMRTVALLLTLALLLFGLYRFLNSRHRAEPRVPKLPAQLALLAPPVPALELRHQAVLAQGNLSEAARELARQAFTTLGVPPAAGAAVPTFTVAGSWWQRLMWGRRVRQLWELAALGRGRRVSSAGLRHLAARLHDLHAAVEGGKLHFVAAN